MRQQANKGLVVVDTAPLVQLGKQFERQFVHVNDMGLDAVLLSLANPTVPSQPDAAALDDASQSGVLV